MAEIGTPAAIRPMTGTETVADVSSLVATGAGRDGGGGGGALPRLPSITLGANFFCALSPGAMESGGRNTSSARALFGRRRIKPRSSKAVIRRWIPDFEARSSASFISSKDGGMPVSFRRSWMNSRSSCCLRVNMGDTLPAKNREKQNQNEHYMFQSCS